MSQISHKPDTPIQSYIRVRPPLGLLKERKSSNLEIGKREVSIKSSSSDFQKCKIFTFDRVFDEDSKQVAVYSTIVRPMIKEVIQGYNCTVFAYGQTGTGKTYTMSGPHVDTNTNWEEDIHAGIIPRALEDIFNELAAQKNEHQVYISFMELYNERLSSLLANGEEENKIQLIDGNDGGVLFKGLNPTPVNNRMEAIELLLKGASRKQIAMTQLNDYSSRSHTIVTITVNVKESIMGQEEVLRQGKLHLVDLAGSENVSKSGANEKTNKSASGVNKRLTEAANINKSLLTLGRVITSITENHPHVPYRESKLTRLLRDSLGGKTKTCIIGTISPNSSSMDETESTLNYVSKARFIKNKPEKNQTISRKEFMQVASEEILKLKRDLEAVPQGDGFYISKETHEEMIEGLKQLNEQVSNCCERSNKLNESFNHHKELYSALRDELDEKSAEQEEAAKIFQAGFDKLNNELEALKKQITMRESMMINEYKINETHLTQQCQRYKTAFQNALEQNISLIEKAERTDQNHLENAKVLQQFQQFVSSKMNEFDSFLADACAREQVFFQKITSKAGDVVDLLHDEKNVLKNEIEKFQSFVRQQMTDFVQSTTDKTSGMISKVDGMEKPASEQLSNNINVIKSVLSSVDHRSVFLNNRVESIFEEASSLTRHLREIIESCHLPRSYKQAWETCKDVSNHIQKEINELMSRIDDSSQTAKRSAYLTMKAIKQAAELQTTLSQLKSNSIQSMEDINRMRHSYDKLTNDIGEIKSAHNEMDISSEKMLKKTRFCLNAVESQASQIGTHGFNLKKELSGYKTNVKNGLETLEGNVEYVKELYQKNNENLISEIINVEKYLERGIKDVVNVSNTHISSFRRLVNTLDEGPHEKLREQITDIHTQSESTDQHMSDSKNKVADILESIKGITYVMEETQGCTAQRVNPDDMDWSTETSELSQRKLAQEYNLSHGEGSDKQISWPSDSSQATSSSEDIDVLGNIGVNEPGENKEMLQSTSSSSRPDINPTPPVVENKENSDDEEPRRKIKRANDKSVSYKRIK